MSVLDLYVLILITHIPLFHYGSKWIQEMMDEADKAYDDYIQHSQL